MNISFPENHPPLTPPVKGGEEYMQKQNYLILTGGIC